MAMFNSYFDITRGLVCYGESIVLSQFAAEDWSQLVSEQLNQWIGLRENLQETIDFPIKYGAFL